MWLQFFWENLHFAANLLTGLAFFSIFWLYFDAWKERKTVKEGWKILGFLLLSLSFLLHSILIESSVLSSAILVSELSEKLAMLLRNLGYLSLVVGLVSDPLIPKPKLLAIVPFGVSIFYFLSPLLAVSAAWLYLRRATIGLENHTKKVSLAFFFMAIYEFLTIPSLFVESLDVNVFRLVSPFGPVWILAHIILILGSSILIKWTFSYLLKRINTQLFIIFTTTTLLIFLLTTISFTFLLLKNLSDETLTRLNTDVTVLSYSLDVKKSEALATALILSHNPKVADAVVNKDKKYLATASEELLLSRRVTSVIVVDENGQVLARGEERDRIGDSVSENVLFKRSMLGEEVSSLVTQDSALSPIVLVKAAVPIKFGEKVVGATIIGLSLDNNFLDGIKKITGLEVGIYGSDILSATTISDLRGKTRPVGIRETNDIVIDKVMLRGESYSGLVSLLNTSYFAVYYPLKDVDNEVVGMLLAGKAAIGIFTAAGKSIELTFLVTVLLMILSILPSYLVSKYIFNQLK
ncbi:MAG TPA: cache domain-containing protein [Candidatus Methanoperedens sp.]|nr:cache domain-containing protein [Candidatus Methanoperedens sp.]